MFRSTPFAPLVFALVLAGPAPVSLADEVDVFEDATALTGTKQAADQPLVVPNNLTSEEVREGFTLLFDGRSFNGWSNPGNWIIEGDALYCEERGGGLTYVGDRLSDDFELRFEWRITRGTSTGILYRPGRYEYQIVDDARHPEGRNPRTATASLAGAMAPSKDAGRPAGQWNTGRIVCRGNVIQHWQNGEKVVDFDYTDERWREDVKRMLRRGTNLAARGTTLHLQDHEGHVWFRSLRYRQLFETDDIEHATVTPADIPAEALEEEQRDLEQLQRLRLSGPPSH